jgi:hypothetical protein
MVLVQKDKNLQEHVIYSIRKDLVDGEISYVHVKKLALATIRATQQLQHYIILWKMIVIANMNPFQYVINHWMIGGKFSKWIVILQEFNMEFMSSKSKKFLVFTELISELPREDENGTYNESIIYNQLILINSCDPWYNDILV